MWARTGHLDRPAAVPPLPWVRGMRGPGSGDVAHGTKWFTEYNPELLLYMGDRLEVAYSQLDNALPAFCQPAFAASWALCGTVCVCGNNVQRLTW